MNYRDFFKERSSGIYKIKCLISGKCYIGQANNLYFRIRRHCQRHLEQTNKKTYNKVLYRAIRKHGLENFSCEILCKAPKEYLNKLEIYFIKYYNSYKKGYNSTKGGSSIPLLKPKKRIIPKIKKNKTKVVYKFNSEGILINKFPSITFLRKTGFPLVSLACNYKLANNTNFYKGFYWMFEKDFKEKGFLKIIPISLNKELRSKITKEACTTRKKVVSLKENGDLIKIYNSLAETTIDGYCYQDLCKIFSGRKKNNKHKDVYWMTLKDYNYKGSIIIKPTVMNTYTYLQLNKENEIVNIHKYQKDILKYFNVSKCVFTKAIKNKTLFKGYYWEKHLTKKLTKKIINGLYN